MIRTKAGWVGGANFGTWIADVRTNQAIIVRAGIEAAAEGLRDDLRQDVEQAGLGERLGNAIGANVYPRSEKGSLDAAGYVFPRGRKANAIFESFNEASLIRARRGKYLAIPTENAGRGARFTKSSPQEFTDRTGIKLRLLRSRKGTLLLVGDAIAAKSGHGVRRVTKGRVAQGRNRQTLVFFILIPVAHMTRRLRFEAKAKLWADRIPDLIDAAGKGVGDG